MIKMKGIRMKDIVNEGYKKNDKNEKSQ